MIRAYDGSVLAGHTNNDPISGYRTCTIVRAENGTTAATHADTTAITRYVAPRDIERLCMAEAIATLKQENAAWGRTIGAGEGAIEFRAAGLAALWKSVRRTLKRWRYSTV